MKRVLITSLGVGAAALLGVWVGTLAGLTSDQQINKAPIEATDTAGESPARVGAVSQGQVSDDVGCEPCGDATPAVKKPHNAASQDDNPERRIIGRPLQHQRLIPETVQSPTVVIAQLPNRFAVHWQAYQAGDGAEVDAQMRGVVSVADDAMSLHWSAVEWDDATIPGPLVVGFEQGKLVVTGPCASDLHIHLSMASQQILAAVSGLPQGELTHNDMCQIAGTSYHVDRQSAGAVHFLAGMHTRAARYPAGSSLDEYVLRLDGQGEVSGLSRLSRSQSPIGVLALRCDLAPLSDDVAALTQ